MGYIGRTGEQKCSTRAVQAFLMKPFNARTCMTLRLVRERLESMPPFLVLHFLNRVHARGRVW